MPKVIAKNGSDAPPLLVPFCSPGTALHIAADIGGPALQTHIIPFYAETLLLAYSVAHYCFGQCRTLIWNGAESRRVGL